MNYLTGIRLNGFPEQSSYLANLPVVKYLQSLEELAFEKPVTFFVGENGTGKSTLLEAIAVALGFNPEGGSRDFSFSTKSSHSVLHQYLTTIKSGYPKDGFFLRAESFYNTATYLDEHSTLLRYGGVSFHAQSHGESFLSLVTNRFEGNGLYILDEPTTGLHFEDIRQLLDVLAKLVDRGNTVIVIEHNLDVIKVADHIIDIGPEGGAAGGEIVAAGTPHEVARCKRSYTGEFLKKLGL